MKRNHTILLCTVLFSLVALESVFALDHSGSITQDETWAAAYNPHIIRALTTVSGNATLTIEAGAVIRFDPTATNPRLIIGSSTSAGKLIAMGTEENNILFTSNAPTPQPGDWNNIVFWPNAADGSVIEHAIIEYGGYADQGSLNISESNPAIRNCTVRYSADSGIKLYLSEAEISNCNFEANSLYGVNCDGFSGILNGNAFINNGSYPIRIYTRRSPNPVVNVPNTFNSNNPDQVYLASSIESDYTLINFGIPYFFPGLVTVSHNATLTIEPGVEVRFNQASGNPRLIVQDGKLMAVGTESEKIVFTSDSSDPQPGDWNNIVLWQDAADDSVIEHAIIEYGGYSSQGSLYISDVSPAIRNCVVRYSADSGIKLYLSEAEISDCTFEENALYGVDCDGFSGLLNGNHFVRNESYPIHLYLRQKPNPVVSIPNTFDSNNPDKIYFTPGINRDYRFIDFGIPYVFLSNITVNNNATLVIDPGVEIDLNTGCSLIVGGSSPGRLIAMGTDAEKIKFTSNFSTPNPGDWNWIYFNPYAESSSVLENVVIEYGGSSSGSLSINGSSPTIRKCTVQHSATNGITLTGSSSVITCCDIQHNPTGIYASASSPIISLNNISDNIDWGVYNVTSSMFIDAKFNWWGHLSGPAGFGTGSGDDVSDYVNYQPWSAAISDCSICRGDFEPDGDVDGKDFYEITNKYGCISNCGFYDMTGDGAVDSDDIYLFALFFGRNDCLP